MRGPATTTGELRRLQRALAAGLSVPEAACALGRSLAWAQKWHTRIGTKRRVVRGLAHAPAWLFPHREAEARARLAGLLAPLQLYANTPGQSLDGARFSQPASAVSGDGKENARHGAGREFGVY